jgi:hypothetical protein
MYNMNRNRHRHGGKRIPGFVRPEERVEKRHRPTTWFASIQELFGGRRGH